MKKNKNKKKPIKTRDYNMVNIINGATKAGVHKDRKKEANKYAAREEVDEDVERCRQCNFPLKDGVPTDNPDGFCSDSCKEYYEEQLGE